MSLFVLLVQNQAPGETFTLVRENGQAVDVQVGPEVETGPASVFANVASTTGIGTAGTTLPSTPLSLSVQPGDLVVTSVTGYVQTASTPLDVTVELVIDGFPIAGTQVVMGAVEPSAGNSLVPFATQWQLDESSDSSTAQVSITTSVGTVTATNVNLRHSRVPAAQV
jgi:hypothetical protein